MNIVIVDDNEKFRATLKMYIEQKLMHKVVAECSSGEEFIGIDPVLIRTTDIVLMDIMMKDLDGIKTTELMTWEHKNLKVIAVTMHSEKLYLTKVLEAGFKGCISKTDVFEELGKSLEQVYKGHLYVKEFIDDKFGINDAN